MFVFSIYCGLDTNGLAIDSRSLLNSLASDAFPGGHTVIDAVGRWMGAVGTIDENTVCVQVMGDDSMRPAIRGFAQAYRDQANQESVMVTATPAAVDFI